MSPRGILAPILITPLVACAPSGTAFSGMEETLKGAVVDVDGIGIHVVSAGLSRREAGEPVVVFESGGSAPLQLWESVLPTIARMAPVLAYDRPGTGKSPWDSLPPVPGRVGSRLRALLSEVGAGPPYIVVGHSWGGALARFFAGQFPDQIAGVLYIDPMDITQTAADELAVFESIGAGAPGRDAFYRMMEQGMASATPAVRSEATVILDLLNRDLDQRGLGPAPEVPTSVILAGRPPKFPPGVLPFDTEAYARATQEGRRERLRLWMRAPGRFIEAANAGHLIHLEEPELVIDEIRHLVQLAR